MLWSPSSRSVSKDAATSRVQGHHRFGAGMSRQADTEAHCLPEPRSMQVTAGMRCVARALARHVRSPAEDDSPPRPYGRDRDDPSQGRLGSDSRRKTRALRADDRRARATNRFGVAARLALPSSARAGALRLNAAHFRVRAGNLRALREPARARGRARSQPQAGCLVSALRHVLVVSAAVNPRPLRAELEHSVRERAQEFAIVRHEQEGTFESA
jgi:hypothetical protein